MLGILFLSITLCLLAIAYLWEGRKKVRHNTTMFRCKYKATGDNATLRGTEGWAWCEASQPGLTYLKWYYAVDNDPDNRTHMVVAPLELDIVRSWSKKKDAQDHGIPGDTERSMKYALSMLKDPYDLVEIRKLLGIPDLGHNEVQQEETVDLDAMFAQHDLGDEQMNERQARDLRHMELRQEAMAKIDAALGNPIGEEDDEETEAPVLQDSETIDLSDLFSETPKASKKKLLVQTQSPVAQVLENSPVLRTVSNEVIDLSELFGEKAPESDDSMVVDLAELFG